VRFVSFVVNKASRDVADEINLNDAPASCQSGPETFALFAVFA